MRKAAMIGAAIASAIALGGTLATLPSPPAIPKPAERTERHRFGAGASKKRRRPRSKVKARGNRTAKKLARVNETHRNMETTVYPIVTDFGPPRRRPGRMKGKPLSVARAVYRPDHSTLDMHGPRNQPRAKYFKPTYAGVSAGRR